MLLEATHWGHQFLQAIVSTGQVGSAAYGKSSLERDVKLRVCRSSSEAGLHFRGQPPVECT